MILAEDLGFTTYLADLVRWAGALTGYQVTDDVSLAPLGVKIDHRRKVIQIHAGLAPSDFCIALTRACARVLHGPAAAPEFREHLRLVRGEG